MHITILLSFALIVFDDYRRYSSSLFILLIRLISKMPTWVSKSLQGQVSMAYLSIDTSVISVWSKWLLVVFCCKTSPYNKTPPGYLGRPRGCQDVRTLHNVIYFTYRNNLTQPKRVKCLYSKQMRMVFEA